MATRNCGSEGGTGSDRTAGSTITSPEVCPPGEGVDKKGGQHSGDNLSAAGAALADPGAARSGASDRPGAVPDDVLPRMRLPGSSSELATGGGSILTELRWENGTDAFIHYASDNDKQARKPSEVRIEASEGTIKLTQNGDRVAVKLPGYPEQFIDGRASLSAQSWTQRTDGPSKDRSRVLLHVEGNESGERLLELGISGDPRKFIERMKQLPAAPGEGDVPYLAADPGRNPKAAVLSIMTRHNLQGDLTRIIRETREGTVTFRGNPENDTWFSTPNRFEDQDWKKFPWAGVGGSVSLEEDNSVRIRNGWPAAGMQGYQMVFKVDGSKEWKRNGTEVTINPEGKVTSINSDATDPAGARMITYDKADPGRVVAIEGARGTSYRMQGSTLEIQAKPDGSSEQTMQEAEKSQKIDGARLSVSQGGLIKVTDETGSPVRFETANGDTFARTGENHWQITEKAAGEKPYTSEFDGFVTDYKGAVNSFSKSGIVKAWTESGVPLYTNHLDEGASSLEIAAARKAVEEARDATGREQSFNLFPVTDAQQPDLTPRELKDRGLPVFPKARYTAIAFADKEKGSAVYETAETFGRRPWLRTVEYSSGLSIRRPGWSDQGNYTVSIGDWQIGKAPQDMFPDIKTPAEADAFAERSLAFLRKTEYPQLADSLVHQAEQSPPNEGAFYKTLAARVRAGDDSALFEVHDLTKHRMASPDAERTLRVALRLAAAAKPGGLPAAFAAELREAAFGLANDDNKVREDARSTIAEAADRYPTLGNGESRDTSEEETGPAEATKIGRAGGEEAFAEAATSSGPKDQGKPALEGTGQAGLHAETIDGIKERMLARADALYSAGELSELVNHPEALREKLGFTKEQVESMSHEVRTELSERLTSKLWGLAVIADAAPSVIQSVARQVFSLDW